MHLVRVLRRACGVAAQNTWSIALEDTFHASHGVAAVAGFRNLTDDYYELAWGFPQPGRTFYFKVRAGL